MAGQTQTNPVAVKLGASAVAAATAAAGKTTTVDFQARLPAGIENGVARLIKAGVAPVKNGNDAGKPLFTARFSVLRPEHHQGSKVAGLQDSFMEALYDTPQREGQKARKTVADHWAYLFEYLRTWGVNTSVFSTCKTDAEVSTKLAAVCAGLVNKKLCVQFRTWAGKKQGIEQRGGKWVVFEEDGKDLETFPTELAARAKYRYIGKDPLVNVVWGGPVAAPPVAPPAANMDDDSGAPEKSGADDDVPADDGDVVVDEVPDAVTDGAGNVIEGSGELTDEDVDALVELADSEESSVEKDDATVKLADWAQANGIAEDDVNTAPSYAIIVEWVRAGGKPADEPEPLKKGDVVVYKAPAGPGKTKAVECEVTKLYKDKNKKDVADLLSNVDRKTAYKAVAVEKLERT